ncbi:glycosyltransferase family 4 protein [Nitrogeniibacter mangrovi]|uniref:Glycosyltransferase family 4 protein n=1 Tax=Nitrogeniibacter mangrovi TaxID=2016596 RepID=A0A6C1B8A1_9RHOO|nr:glycosyltransferase [Nitrogeniibacter mangrovi]QID18560.1 glycosyltransferase family 4 protein [Nitrogeniibacter mangrovi]
MNVLMLSDVYFPRINGVSTSIETFRHALAPHGVSTTLVAPAYPAQRDDDGSIIRIPSRYLPIDPEDRIMRRAAIRNTVARLRELAPRIVHVQTPFVAHYAGIEIAQQLGVPCVCTYHTFFEEYLYHYVPFAPRTWLKAAARRFSRTQCNALDAIIVPSSAMRDTLAAYGVTRPMHVLPTGIPMNGFHGGDGAYFRERYDIDPDARMLLFVGRVAHEKNIGLLIDMVDRLRRAQPKAVLVVTGEGPALASLRAHSERLGLDAHVRFLGYLDRHHELHDCYRAADLFVFASRTETQGLVLLEAMALGTPVVAVAEMGTRDILGPQRGCRIAPAEADGFASTVDTLLRDDPLRRQLAHDAHEYARTWSADVMAGRLAALYRDIVGEASSPAASSPRARNAA